MLASDNFVYVQFQKTGCTHIAHLLETYFDVRRFDKHSFYNKPKDERLFIGSMRNPWDWYVSLWAFGCSGKGAVRARFDEVMEKRARLRSHASYANFPDAVDWTKVYADPLDGEQFRLWLRAMMGQPGQRAMASTYAKSSLRHCTGFMGYRFCQFHTRFGKLDALNAHVATNEELAAFYAEHKLIDRFIRMEQLEEDLSQVMAALGQPVRAEDLKAHGKTNASAHQPWFDYYDQETSDLVAAREAFLIDLFGYKGPFEQAVSAA